MPIPEVTYKVCETIATQSQRDHSYTINIIKEFEDEQPSLKDCIKNSCRPFQSYFVAQGMPEELESTMESMIFGLSALMYKSIKNQIEADELNDQSKIT